MAGRTAYDLPTREKHLGMRATEAEAEKLIEAARREGMRFGTWARRTLLAAAAEAAKVAA